MRVLTAFAYLAVLAGALLLDAHALRDSALPLASVLVLVTALVGRVFTAQKRVGDVAESARAVMQPSGESRPATVMARAGIMSASLDAAGSLNWVSGGLAQRLGAKPEELAGVPLAEVFGPLESEPIANA